MRITGYKRKDTEVEGLIEMESIAIVADAKKTKGYRIFPKFSCRRDRENG